MKLNLSIGDLSIHKDPIEFYQKFIKQLSLKSINLVVVVYNTATFLG